MNGLPRFETITRDEALAFILSGMQAKRAEIDATLRDLRSQQNGEPEVVERHHPSPLAKIYQTKAFKKEWAESTNAKLTPKRRKLSRAARKAISDAQKRRWAKVRGGN